MENWLEIANKVNTEFNNSEFGKLSDYQVKMKERFTCEKCGKTNLDIGNYSSLHGLNCKFSHITKELILDAQSKFNTGKEIWESLNLSRKTYIGFCEQFGIEIKFADLNKIKQVSSNVNSKELRVWKYDSTKEDGKGEFLGSFKSISIAANQLKISRVYIDDCIKKRYPTAKPKYIFEKDV